MRYYAKLPDIDPEAGLSEAAVQALDDLNARYALVFGHYLGGSISLARAAELLDMPWLELRTRCLRLDVPLRTSPQAAAEAAGDVAAIEAW